MAHGTPDWGLVGPKDIVYGLDDLGEQAARLGSPHLWDRRGDVLYLTTFREGLGMFWPFTSGVGADVRLSTGHSRQGAYSVCLRTGSTLQQYAAIQLALPFQDPSAVGLEFSWGAGGGNTLLRGDISWYDGVNEHYARVRYDYWTNDVSYWTAAGGWAVLEAGVWRHLCARPEHTMKLVVDMSLHQYLRFLLDERAYDLAGIPAQVVALPTAPYWSFMIWHIGFAELNIDAWVDNVIITQNEPH